MCFLPSAALSAKPGSSANIFSATNVAQEPTGSMVALQGSHRLGNKEKLTTHIQLYLHTAQGCPGAGSEPKKIFPQKILRLSELKLKKKAAYKQLSILISVL